MNCRVPGCSKIEWMARELCDRHWKMLPEDLQLRIRNALRHWRVSGGGERQQLRAILDELFNEALAIIQQIEAAMHDQAKVTLFRVRMASVAGMVATLRQLPIDEIHAQLAQSSDELRRDFPGTYADREEKIAMDLELLAALSDCRIKLGDIIQRYAPPAPTAEDTAGNEVTVPE